MASDLELSPAAVERGAEAYYEFAKDSKVALRYRPDWLKDECRSVAEAVLTAALRLDDPETRARVAQAIRFGVLAGPARGKGTYDDVADLAVQALLGAEDEEAEDG